MKKITISRSLPPIVLSMLLLFAISCGSDPIDPIDQCQEIPGDPTRMYQVRHYPAYAHPCFNPLNSDEFVYFRFEEEGGDAEMRIHNLVSHHDTLIYRGSLLSKPDWGAKDWILFNQYDNQIWKIRSDGSQLTPLTNEGISADASWDATGERFISWTTGNGTALISIRDSEGQILDTVYQGFKNGAWAPKPTVITGFYESGGSGPLSIIRYGLNDTSYASIEIGKGEFVEGLAHFRENGFIASIFNGASHSRRLFSGGFQSGNLKLIQAGCETNHFSSFSLNSSEDKILASRTLVEIRDTSSLNGEILEGGGLHYYRSIWMMDVDGQNLNLVELP